MEITKLAADHAANVGTELLIIEGERVPEVTLAYELALTDPGIVWRLFLSYGKIIEKISSLTQEDLQIIEAANVLNKQTGSASHHSVVDFLRDITSFDKLNLPAIFYSISNPDGEFYKQALEILGNRMSLGHEMKLRGKKPVDGDDESDRSIYGHTQLEDPEILIQFTLCHLIERYMSEVFKEKGLEMAHTKDWFLNAITDVLALSVVKGEKVPSKILNAWTLERASGGLGWLSSKRIYAFQSALINYHLENVEPFRNNPNQVDFNYVLHTITSWQMIHHTPDIANQIANFPPLSLETLSEYILAGYDNSDSSIFKYFRARAGSEEEELKVYLRSVLIPLIASGKVSKFNNSNDDLYSVTIDRLMKFFPKWLESSRSES